MKKAGRNKMNSESRKENRKENDGAAPKVVMLSLPTLAFALIGSCVGAFLVGRSLASVSVVRFDLNPLPPANHKEEVLSGGRMSVTLPPPPLLAGKEIPSTRYTSRRYDGGAKVTSSNAMLNHDGSADCILDSDGSQKCGIQLNNNSYASYDQFEAPTDDVHEPSGQHLLVDIKNVDASFLDSEERLATAMIDVVRQSDLTLLSYHCHGLEPEGVSCVGVLLESHVSFHTWPKEGVITLDLFTCGPKSLLPLVKVMENLFGVPRETGDKPELIWTHKKRGFRRNRKSMKALSDLELFLGNVDLLKEEVLSTDTDYQKIDVYDAIDTRFRTVENYQKSISNDGSYESLHPELYQKDRLLFINGDLQSRLYGEPAYYEALVHPAMMTHPNPQRVLIIGGATGAVVREVLKHQTVEKVVILEIDSALTKLSQTHLKAWNDCSNLISSTESCFDDPRVEVVYADAVDWVMNKYFGNAVPPADLFDVVIMDADDPDSYSLKSLKMYANHVFLQALYSSLGEKGILVSQMGQAPPLEEVSRPHSKDPLVYSFLTSLQGVGFAAAQEYEEMHGRLGRAWRFVVVMKDRTSRSLWFQSEAELSLSLRNRMVQTRDGSFPLKYFDSATMMQYQLPTRAAEERFCKARYANPDDCPATKGPFVTDLVDHPSSSFEVKTSSVGGGRGVFAKVDIAAGDYLALSDCVHSMFVPSTTYSLLHGAMNKFELEFWETVTAGYMDGYGVQVSNFGEPSVVVDAGLMTFTNHGCNGTYNTGIELDVTEATLSVGTPLKDIFGEMNDFHNPYQERSTFSLFCQGLRALKDIHAGDELLDNYVVFGTSTDQEEFDLNLLEVKSMCQGEPGVVQIYEIEDEI